MIVDRVTRGLEQRETTFAKPDAWLTEALGGGPTYSGKSMSPKTSLRLIPVFASVRIIAESVGSLPLHVFRRVENGRERAESSKVWQQRVLGEAPNEEMAAGQFYETLTGHLNLWGNAFVEKQKMRVFGGGEQVDAMWPIAPSRVQVERNQRGDKRFRIDGHERTFGEDTILHIPAFGYDGLVGLSPIQQCREDLGTIGARGEYQGRFFANNATPGGYIKHPKSLGSQEAVERLKAGWRAKHRGLKNAHEAAVLEEGAEWVATGIPLRDQQFIELAQFDTTQVANLFRIPPSMIGAPTGDSMTYGNRESDAINFVTYSLLRWLKRITEALWRDRDLFHSRRYYPEFVVQALMRGDAGSRGEFYQTMHDLGAITVAEIREREDMPPLPHPSNGAVPPKEGEQVIGQLTGSSNGN
ncbi:MAG: phage portal protein [Actinomycetota bacterium]|nr:phage portal protein [Actinomycetota bacterium]